MNKGHSKSASSNDKTADSQNERRGTNTKESGKKEDLKGEGKSKGVKGKKEEGITLTSEWIKQVMITDCSG